MRRLTVAVLISTIASRPAIADFAEDYIRVACVPEAGFFEFEAYELHAGPASAAAQDVWAKHGFIRAKAARYECTLGSVKYTLIADQAEWRERGSCGADPDVFVTLHRDNKVLLDGVAFGDSCFRIPSINSVTLVEGRAGWYGPQAAICFSREELFDKGDCAAFYDDEVRDKVFPLSQQTLQEWIDAQGGK